MDGNSQSFHRNSSWNLGTAGQPITILANGLRVQFTIQRNCKSFEILLHSHGYIHLD